MAQEDSSKPASDTDEGGYTSGAGEQPAAAAPPAPARPGAAAPQPPEIDSPAPDEWDAFSDDETGEIYYVNQRTQETTWDKPAAVAAKEASSADILGGNDLLGDLG